MARQNVCVPLHEVDLEALETVKVMLARQAPGASANTASAVRFALRRTAAESNDNAR